MSILKKLLLVGAFALVPAVLAGCSCVKNDCAPPPPPPPRPRPAPTVCNPCAALPAPVSSVAPATASAPAPFCTTGSSYCQIVPPGTTIYSDPPTVTVSSTGEVLNRTPATYRPATSGTAYQPAPQATAVSTYNVPRSANVRTT